MTAVVLCANAIPLTLLVMTLVAVAARALAAVSDTISKKRTASASARAGNPTGSKLEAADVDDCPPPPPDRPPSEVGIEMIQLDSGGAAAATSSRDSVRPIET